jgi:hypothetical protein
MIKVECVWLYIEELQMWHAGYQDELGRLGTGFTAEKRDDAIFAKSMGLSMGRNPERHSRPLGDYLEKTNPPSKPTGGYGPHQGASHDARTN